MYIFDGIKDWVGADRLCIATRRATSDRCHYRHGKQSAVAKNSVRAMLIIGEGLILYYVC